MRKRILSIPTLAMTVGAAFQLATPVAAGGGGCHAAVHQARAVKVDIVNFCFDPDIIRVAPGQTVTWTNGDQAEHTVSGVAGSFGNYESIRPGASVAFTFGRDGLYPFFCAFHPGMVGVVSVGSGSGLGAPSTQPPVAPARVAPAAAESHNQRPASGLSLYPLALILLGLSAAAGVGFRLARDQLSHR